MFEKLARRIPAMSVGQLLFIFFGISLLAGAGLILLFSTSIKNKAINEIAQDEAREMSTLVFETLYTAMSKGWSKDEISEIINRLNRNERRMTIRVFRGEPVIRQFGETPGERKIWEADDKLKRSMEKGEEVFLSLGESVRYIYPIHVSEGCLECHTEAKIGDVNGLIDMTIPVTNLKTYSNQILDAFVASFTLVLIVIFIALYVLLRMFMAGPIMRLEGVIQEIIHHTDLNKRIPRRNGWIKELETLSSYFNKMLSSLQDYNARLEELSIRDPLTKLYNRRKFEEVLESEIRRSKRSGAPFSLVMLDLDNFKHINDNYGHPIGDMALKEMSIALEGSVRSTDIVFRIGGDEFAVIMPDTNISHGTRAANKLCGLLSKTDIELPSGKIKMTASFGLVEYPRNGDVFEDLSISMDVAMYKAKRYGKNRVAVLEDADKLAVEKTYTMAESARKALEEDRLEVFLQPIVNLKTGAVFAYEALARIRENGYVIDAAQFIGAAQDMGLAKDVDKRMFEKGLEIKLRAPDLAEAKIFFNLSPSTFCDFDYMRSVSKTLKGFGLSSGEVVFEITEREALPHISELAALTEELRREGVSFALDDFGSGFSSFMYLKYLTVDYIKIEGSFIHHLASDSSDKIMVKHIKGVAHDFGIRAIGECVEDERTSRILKAMGIDFAQGNHYGRPAPYNEPDLVTGA